MLSPSFYSFVRFQIENNKAVLDAGFSHDWLIYTMARSFKYSIYHDSSSKILYRQHSSNVQGSLIGFKGFCIGLRTYGLIGITVKSYLIVISLKIHPMRL